MTTLTLESVIRSELHRQADESLWLVVSDDPVASDNSDYVHVDGDVHIPSLVRAMSVYLTNELNAATERLKATAS